MQSEWTAEVFWRKFLLFQLATSGTLAPHRV